jgi:hypothetical protein
MKQFRLHLVQELLTLMMLGQVAYKANKLPVPLQQYLTDRKLHRKRATILALTDNDAPHPDHTTFAGGEITRQIAVVVLAM